MDNRPILVMLFADDCGWCTKFKTESYEKLATAVKQYGKIVMLPITAKQRGTPLPLTSAGFTVPVELNKLLIHYPLFILISRNDWNTKNVMNALIYGAVISVKGEVVSLPVEPANEKTLLDWVKANLDTLGNGKSELLTATGPESAVADKPSDEVRYLPSMGSCKFKIVPRK